MGNVGNFGYLCATMATPDHTPLPPMGPLLPVVPYDPFDREQSLERKRAMQLTLEFNNTGDKTPLRELFGCSLKGVFIEPPLHCNYGGSHVRWGRRITVGFNCSMQSWGGITLGDGVYIGPDVKFYTAVHPLEPERRAAFEVESRPIVVGNDVWIGGGSILLPGVQVGDGATIGAGSVVNRSVPPRCVVAGNPARIIKVVPQP